MNNKIEKKYIFYKDKIKNLKEEHDILSEEFKKPSSIRKTIKRLEKK